MGIQKAIVSFIGGALFLLNYFFQINIGIDEATLQTIVAVILPILTTWGVWQVENKTPDA